MKLQKKHIKNSSDLWVSLIKSEGYTGHPAIWNFLFRFKNIYFDLEAPVGILWAGEKAKCRVFDGSILPDEESIFLFGNYRNQKEFKEFLKGKNKNFREIQIKIPLSEGPLSKRFFFVVRPMPDALEFAYSLELLGARAIPFPVLKFKIIEPRNFKKIVNQKWDYIVFTSKRGVSASIKLLSKYLSLEEFFHNKNIVAIGPKTAKKIDEIGYPSCVPDEYTQEGIVKLFRKKRNKKILILRTQGRKFITESLKKKGFECLDLKIYNMVMEDKKLLNYSLSYMDKATDVIFTSPKLFDGFLKFIGKNEKKLLKKKRIISIGRVTADYIKSKGFDVELFPEKFTGDSLIHSIIERSSK